MFTRIVLSRAFFVSIIIFIGIIGTAKLASAAELFTMPGIPPAYRFTRLVHSPLMRQAAPAPASTASVSPEATATSGTFVAQVESYVVQYTNDERAKRGLPALKNDSKLAAIARAHSTDMIKNNYFSHVNLSGCSASCRMTAAGYLWRAMGENIHWMSGYNLSASATAKKIVTDWMNSSGHRANILSTKFTVVGVGVATSGSKVDTTADYALPR